ncbi:MAG TPA: hypothetical protein VNT60_00680, partial [Deinococcales bacterium]|nr:hypothetical protein [Deinococcales bacterium]
MTQPATGQPIALPEDFRIDFAPGEELLHWTRDRMHFPKPVSPMMHSLVPTEGINGAFRHFGVPLRSLSARFNTYHYRASAPIARSPEEGAAAGAAAGQAINAAALTIGSVWQEQYLPRVLEHIAHLESLDLEGATREQLSDYLADGLARHLDLWDIHFRTVIPVHTAMELFTE